jgi:hypothetical protein
MSEIIPDPVVGSVGKSEANMSTKIPSKSVPFTPPTDPTEVYITVPALHLEEDGFPHSY